MRSCVLVLLLLCGLAGTAQVAQVILFGGAVLPDLRPSDRISAMDPLGTRFGLSYQAGSLEGLRIGLGLEVEQLSLQVEEGYSIRTVKNARSQRATFGLFGVQRIASSGKSQWDAVLGLLICGTSLHVQDKGSWFWRDIDQGGVYSVRLGMRYVHAIARWAAFQVEPSFTIPVIQRTIEYPPSALRNGRMVFDLPERSVQVGLTIGLVLGPFAVGPKR